MVHEIVLDQPLNVKDHLDNYEDCIASALDDSVSKFALARQTLSTKLHTIWKTHQPDRLEQTCNRILQYESQIQHRVASTSARDILAGVDFSKTRTKHKDWSEKDIFLHPKVTEVFLRSTCSILDGPPE